MAFTNFIERLQAADEETKKVWVVAGTTAVMVIIIAVWLTWFSGLNSFAGVPGGEQAIVSHQASDHGFSFFETMKSGFGAMFEKFKTPKDYMIKPQE